MLQAVLFLMFLLFLGHELLDPAIHNEALWPWLRKLFRKTDRGNDVNEEEK